MVPDQREMVERSLTHENGQRLPARGSRRTYTLDGERARKVEPGEIISTTWGAYWEVLSKDVHPDDVTLLVDAVSPTDLRTHNGVVTMLFGGTLI